MPKFPVDAPKSKVVGTLRSLGFQVVREREHISMVRQNADGTRTPLTMPNHPRINGATLRTICRQSGISREDFCARLRKFLIPKKVRLRDVKDGTIMNRQRRSGRLPG